MCHAFTANLGPCNLNATTIAHDTFVSDPLVFPAVTLKVLGRAEDTLAEKAVLLRLKRTVVDRLRLCDFAVRPVLDLLRRMQRVIPAGDQEVRTQLRPVPRASQRRRVCYRQQQPLDQ